MLARKGNGKKLSLFLKDGTPNGAIVVSIEGSNLQVISLHRDDLKQYKQTSAGKRGVYLLIGQSLIEANTFDIYVGESKEIESRVSAHDSRNEKTFERVILVSTSDNRFYGHHAKFIEGILIRFLKLHPAINLQNGNAGMAEDLQDDEEDTCWKQMNELALIMQSLGYWFMKDFEDGEWEDNSNALIEKYGLQAHVITEPTLLAETSPPTLLAKKEEAQSLPFDQWPVFEFKGKKRDGKTYHGYLKIHGANHYELLAHSQTLRPNRTRYESPSRAGMDVNDKSINGWKDAWKTPEGETLHDFNERHGNPLNRTVRPRVK